MAVGWRGLWGGGGGGPWEDADKWVQQLPPSFDNHGGAGGAPI